MDSFYCPSSAYDPSSAFDFLEDLDAAGSSQNAWRNHELDLDGYDGGAEWSLFNPVDDAKGSPPLGPDSMPVKLEPLEVTDSNNSDLFLTLQNSQSNSDVTPVSSTPGSTHSSFNSDPEYMVHHRERQPSSNSNMTGNNYEDATFPLTPPYLNANQVDLAMPAGAGGAAANAVPVVTTHTSSSPMSSVKKEIVSPPSATVSATASSGRPRLNRNSSTVSTASASKISKPKKEKTSHNMIEKRYRTNINEKILALRDCVPSLRCVVSGSQQQEVDLEGLTPASKLNKATVLTKATEYILHLQNRNEQLTKELEDLKRAVGAGAAPPVQYANTNMPGSGGNAGVPRHANNNGFGQKMVMGAMAGFMGAGVMTGDDNNRGLAAVPGLSTVCHRAGIDPAVVSNVVRLSLVAAAAMYVIVPMVASLASPKSTKKLRTQQQVGSKSATSQTSQLRAQVWEVTSKTMALPQEQSSKSGVMAWIRAYLTVLVYFVCSKVFTVSVVSKSTQESWARAIDSQLCGGDKTINRSKLLLTLISSYSLPRNANNLARRAVHVKVLTHSTILDKMGTKLAMRYWKQAAHAKGADEVPKHLRTAFEHCEMFCDKDTMDRVEGFAYGLRRPTTEFTPYGDDVGLQSVPRDGDIRAAAEAVGAWYACKLLHQVLIGVLEDSKVDYQRLHLAQDLVSLHSVVGRRVAVVRAMLVGAQDANHIKRAADRLQQDFGQSSEYAEVTPVALDCRMAMYCSFILHYLARGQRQMASQMCRKLSAQHYKSDIGLLGFVAAWLISTQAQDRLDHADAVTTQSLEALVHRARLWIGRTEASGQLTGLSLARQRQLVGQCLKLSAQYSGYNLDEGYYSH
uniref:ARAD1C01452p n=1 Tax=Blastobotrys adeninivorans TaxID=409370 RepID=A0A060T433_BLAAD